MQRSDAQFLLWVRCENLSIKYHLQTPSTLGLPATYFSLLWAVNVFVFHDKLIFQLNTSTEVNQIFVKPVRFIEHPRPDTQHILCFKNHKAAGSFVNI